MFKPAVAKTPSGVASSQRNAHAKLHWKSSQLGERERKREWLRLRLQQQQQQVWWRWTTVCEHTHACPIGESQTKTSAD